jgi:hypothetical protein
MLALAMDEGRATRRDVSQLTLEVDKLAAQSPPSLGTEGSKTASRSQSRTPSRAELAGAPAGASAGFGVVTAHSTPRGGEARPAGPADESPSSRSWLQSFRPLEWGAEWAVGWPAVASAVAGGEEGGPEEKKRWTQRVRRWTWLRGHHWVEVEVEDLGDDDC